MKKQEYENLLTLAMSTGADYAEIYQENSKLRTFNVIDSKLDSIGTDNVRGIGVRIIKENNYYYTATNILNYENIEKIIMNLLKSIPGQSKKIVTLEPLMEKTPKILIPHDNMKIEAKKEFLLNIDREIRTTSSLIKQVSLSLLEDDKNFIIATSEGKYIKSSNCLTRYTCTVHTQKGNIKEREFTDYAQGKGYEILEEVDLLDKSLKAAKSAVDKLDAQEFEGGELPVIIAPGFGAVIFHEACGHGLEATQVAPGISVFANDYGKKIASEKVTLIDDATIENAWGSYLIDDEGNAPQKNILIENGILKNFLVDKINTKRLKIKANGCGRRENYNYAPTSRMSNTYLAPGTDTFEDMLKDIKLGVYCERMSGGIVNPATGDFNFAVSTARKIENGKLTEKIKGITLSGNSKSILKNVEMVSSDLLLSGGYCGSKSGLIYVTIGQPTIKVSKILVGGKE